MLFNLFDVSGRGHVTKKEMEEWMNYLFSCYQLMFEDLPASFYQGVGYALLFYAILCYFVLFFAKFLIPEM